MSRTGLRIYNCCLYYVVLASRYFRAKCCRNSALNKNILTRIALAISFGFCEISPFLMFFIEFLQTNVDLFMTTVLSLPIFSLYSVIKNLILFSFLVIELILKVFFLVLPTFSFGFANSVAN